MTTSLTLTHLRFDLVARSPIKLGGYQSGERLRDALARVMLRAVCPETRRAQKPSPEHAAACPVCWLLAAEIEPGEVRRAYSLVPPLPAPDLVSPGERFSFILTLFGGGFQYLPYFVLAVPEMGQTGVGPGKGQFELESIWAVNPFTKETQAVLSPGDNVVRVPDNAISWHALQETLPLVCKELQDNDNKLQVQFLTPTRLVDGKSLVKSPDFGVLFRRLLERIDQLSQQHAGEKQRSKPEIERLYSLADKVRLVDSNVRWVDIWGPSNRTGRRTPMGGFVGQAAYRTRDWDALLPWLFLGQGMQVGKLAVKGNGVYQIASPTVQRYWDRFASLEAKPPAGLATA